MHPTRLAATLGAVALLAGLPAAAQAQEMAMHKPAGHQVTVRGTVIDVSCKFGQGLTGAEHRMCAQVCADKGIPLAILTADGQLYLPTSAAMPGEAQNARLREFAEQEVEVTGTAFAAGGAQAIQIASIRRRT